MELQEIIERLTKTLEYVQQVVNIRNQPIARLSEYGNISVSEAEADGLPGIQFFPPSKPEFPAWLTLDRLQPSPPPQIPELLTEWIVLSEAVNTEPTIREWVFRTLPLAEIQNLLMQGVANEGNVNQSPQDPELYDVRLYSEDDNQLSAGFDAYLEEWRSWSQTEKPRRKSISLYQRLFGVHQKMIAGEAERPLELVWGLGHAVWNVPGSEVNISHPLIEILVELSLDSLNQKLSIHPRSILQNSKPAMNLEIYESLQIPTIGELRNSFSEILQELDQEERTIIPRDRDSYVRALQSAVSYLSDDARFWPEVTQDESDRLIPEADETLTVTDTWVIFARNKSNNSLAGDIERLKKKAETLENADGVAVLRLTQEPLDEPNHQAYEGPHGPNQPTTGDENDRIIYFPKPYNDAQRRIIDQLDQKEGVVVQGPPGTGKTHTIANIICHYLATGKRVLVTAKSETALNVLKDQIPKKIQPLVVSLVSNDQEGLRQQKAAIETLQNKVVELQGRAGEIRSEIQDDENKVKEISKKLSQNEAQIAGVAKKQLCSIEVPFENIGFQNSADLARWVVNNRESYQWLADDIGLEGWFEPQFTHDDIAALIDAKGRIGSDLDLNGKQFPDPDQLPNPNELRQIHEDLCTVAGLEDSLMAHSFPILELVQTERLQDIIASADRSLNWSDREHSTWEQKLYQLELNQQADVNPIWLEIAVETLSEIEDLVSRQGAFLRNPIEGVSKTTEDLEILRGAASRRLEGKSPYRLQNYFNKRTREVLTGITIRGLEQDRQEYWQHVYDYVDYTLKGYELRSRWNAIAAEMTNLDPIAEGEEMRIFTSMSCAMNEVIDAAKAARECTENCRLLFGEQLTVELLNASRESIANLRDIAKRNLSLQGFQTVKDTRKRIYSQLQDAEIDEAIAISELLYDHLGKRSEEGHLIEEWARFYARIQHLDSLSSDFSKLNEVCNSIQQSGAHQWAYELKANALDTEQRAQLAVWEDAWKWRRLYGLLTSQSDLENLERYDQERQNLEAEQRRLLQSIVEQKTFLKLHSKMSDRARAGLVKFTVALAQIGAGTGINAQFHRRAAQRALDQCGDAVPCWIMPSWRVSEVLPSELGSFDLVIVDEASQCDVREIPAIARGKKILVVGDDKQVSPTAGFVKFHQFLQLQHNYLGAHPFRDLMLPGYSLYDLAGAVFAGGRIMLNEHFRCVEPIIRFSFQFYQDGAGEDLILPLRVPRGSERIDPPLVDIYVEDGYRHQDTNPPEAEAVVQEVKSIVANPALEGRSIGVISLIGRKQAELIQRRLLEEIGMDAFLRHKIICGDSATFQGRERDIIFLSMVAAIGGPINAMTGRMHQQRFNVAASRARDRMYLVHSVRQDDLQDYDLKARLLQHFAEPMPAQIHAHENLIDLCESPFEEDVFKALSKLGYTVRPQVHSMGRRIDLVIEGAGDARLAVELDGDSYHGPEVWLEDWMRQKSLERIGWKFWRCWFSDYIVDPGACMTSLIERLEEERIFPTGEEAQIYKHTDFRFVGNAEDRIDAHTDAEREPNETVEVGDKIILESGAGSSPALIQLIADGEDERNFVFEPSHQMAQALLGKTIGDEVEVLLGGRPERRCIVALEKGGSENGHIRELEHTASDARMEHPEIETPADTPFIAENLPNQENLNIDEPNHVANGPIYIRIDWRALGVNRGVETIQEANDAQTVVKFCERLIAALGEPMVEKLTAHKVIRYPLSRNPEIDFPQYSCRQIPGTDLFLCPHSDRNQKVQRLRVLATTIAPNATEAIVIERT